MMPGQAEQGRTGPEPGGRPPEGQLLPYYLAARFPSKQAAEQSYLQAQETIRTMDCDLSAYRFLVPQQLTELHPWYVTVLGETPPDAVHQKITGILSQGELTMVPEQVLHELFERRLQQIQKGPWIEAHYKPTLKKKDKRQQQKQSRRRNRGR